jgi:hypothetical protein
MLEVLGRMVPTLPDLTVGLEAEAEERPGQRLWAQTAPVRQVEPEVEREVEPEEGLILMEAPVPTGQSTQPPMEQEEVEVAELAELIHLQHQRLEKPAARMVLVAVAAVVVAIIVPTDQGQVVAQVLRASS